MEVLNKHRTIPNGNLIQNIRTYIQRVTGEYDPVKFLWQRSLFTLFAGAPTIAGAYLRGVVYRTVFGHIGRGCLIEKNVRFTIPQNISLGDRVFIGEGSYIDPERKYSTIKIGTDAYISRYCILRTPKGTMRISDSVNIGAFSVLYSYGSITIGRNCMLANHTELLSGQHGFDNPEIPIRFQQSTEGSIEIGEDVWIGAYAIVLPGVCIGKGSVIGAGSVVTDNIPAYSIAAGNPAKVVKKREKKK